MRSSWPPTGSGDKAGEPSPEGGPRGWGRVGRSRRGSGQRLLQYRLNEKPELRNRRAGRPDQNVACRASPIPSTQPLREKPQREDENEDQKERGAASGKLRGTKDDIEKRATENENENANERRTEENEASENEKVECTKHSRA